MKASSTVSVGLGEFLPLSGEALRATGTWKVLYPHLPSDVAATEFQAIRLILSHRVPWLQFFSVLMCASSQRVPYRSIALLPFLLPAASNELSNCRSYDGLHATDLVRRN